MPQNAPSKGLIVIIAAVMAISALVLSIITWSRITGSVAAMTHTRDLQARWEELFSTMKDAETGQRGFLITGDEAYLTPFESAEKSVPGLLAGLATQQAAGGGSMDEVQSVHETVDERLALLREAISVCKREGNEASAALLKTGRGKAAMDRLRHQIYGIQQRLRVQVVMRSDEMQRDLKWGYLSVVGTGVVALGAGLVALLRFRETARQLRREARLAAAKQKAEEADREKSTFLATMSHEIRTPMNAILGFGELLEGEVQTDREKRYVQSILSGGRSLLQIINDILDISKIEAGMMEVAAEPTDLRELAQFIRELFLQQAARKGVELRVEVAPTLPKSLLLDEGRMRQILLNLVGNGMKFTDHGSITLRLGGETWPGERNRWRLVIEVADTGVGIEAEKLGDVFKPFVQAGGKRAAEQKGTGLGLAIVRRLTDLMGGAVSVESEAGKGSTFRLEFREVEVSARLPKAALLEETAVDFNTLRPSTLLVADDNETNRQLVEDIFENTHHRVRFATDGQEAVAAILEQKPDVVLMDIRMPVLDGPGALKELREKPGLELLPVIAVTASSLSAEENELQRAFDGYVRKPFSRAELFREMALFIPRATPAAWAANIGAEPEQTALSEDTAVRWRELAAGLREQERRVWPGLRDGMALLEITQFAESLRSAGEAASCGPLIGYAGRLQAEAVSFSIEALENSLAEFGSLITEIETRANAPTPSA